MKKKVSRFLLNCSAYLDNHASSLPKSVFCNFYQFSTTPNAGQLCKPIKPGMWIYFDTGVKNVGNVDAPETFNIKWFMDGEKVGHGLHKEVKAGETLTLDNSQYIWYSALEGTHTFLFVVDSENHIAESNEGNNEVSVTVTIK